MDTVNKRLAAVRQRLDLNKSAFAAMVGIENSRYNKLENGTAMPAGDALKMLAEKLPSLNLTWLLAGEGQMFIDDKVLLPADLEPPKHQGQTLVAVGESEEMKEVKRDRDKWREMALGLMEQLRQRPQRELASTGTEGPSFGEGSTESADAPMWIAA